jgi:hypothetical protein
MKNEKLDERGKSAQYQRHLEALWDGRRVRKLLSNEEINRFYADCNANIGDCESDEDGEVPHAKSK